MSLKPFAVAAVVAAGALAVAGGARLCSGRCARAASGQTSEASSHAVAIHIEGMDCPACTAAIRIALKKVDGVTDVTVSFADKQAVVHYTLGTVTPQQLTDVVNALGYHATLPAGQKGS